MRLVLILSLLLAIPACKSKTAPPAPPELAALLSGYEELRAGLAQDKSVVSVASKTRVAAETASGAVPRHKASLTAVARTAGELEKAPASDLEAQRAKFGDLSRELLGLAQAEPGLQQGRYVYECPMARGYRKWVQPKPGIENPYMGKSMLECGAESTWAP
jgi:hypothetical protein